MGHQLARIIKARAHIQQFPFIQQALVNTQVAAAVLLFFLMVLDRSVPVYDFAGRRDALMHCTLPPEPGCAAQQPLPVIGENRPPRPVKGCVVRQHDDILCTVQLRLERKKAFPVHRNDHVIRVQPQHIVL